MSRTRAPHAAWWLPLVIGACQVPAQDAGSAPSALPSSAYGAPSFGDTARLKAEIEGLRKENSKLTAEISRLKNQHARPSASSQPASAPVELEERALAGREEQNKLVSQYSTLYVADLYARKLQETPDDPVALYLAARFAENPNKKLSLCERAEQAAPNFGFALHCRSQAHRARGEGALALEAAEKAVELAPMAEFEKNRDELRRLSMEWFSQPLTGLVGEASVRREFSLGPATTKVVLTSPHKGLDCAAATVPDTLEGCAGVLCAQAEFSYSFEGPPDPFYDHTEICGKALNFSDFSGKTLRSVTDLPCSRLDNGKSLVAAVSICLDDEADRVGQVHLSLPGKSAPLSVPGASLPGAAPL